MMSEKMEPLLITKIKSILPSAITNYAIATLTKLGGSSKSFFRMDSTYGPRSYDRSTKLFPCSQSQPDQHKEVAPDDFHKNQCVINARERLKCIEDCKNIIDHARKIKSLNQT